jgi:hypothetical protein
LGNALSSSFIPVGVFDDATLRSIDGTFDALCKELHDIAQAKTSFGHEWDEWRPGNKHSLAHFIYMKSRDLSLFLRKRRSA